MEAYDIVVPTKRKCYIESLYSHYAHTLDAKHLDLAQEIIHSKCPEYDAACKKVYASTWGYMFNMCIMRRTYLDAYCKWLFPILADLEDAMQDDLKSMSAFEARLFGRVSEILFNVWLLKRGREQRCTARQGSGDHAHGTGQLAAKGRRLSQSKVLLAENMKQVFDESKYYHCLL